MKRITVIIRNLPINTRRNAEGLRMSVGLTLRDDKVSVIFIDDGIYSATHLKPEIVNLQPLHKEFEALKLLGCELLGDKVSMIKRGIPGLLSNIREVEREEVLKKITDSDIVIPF